MDAYKIDVLSKYISTRDTFFAPQAELHVPGASGGYESRTAHQSAHAYDIDRFLYYYKSLEFGWKFVKSMIHHGQKLPAEAFEEEALHRAYYFEKKMSCGDYEMRRALSIGLPQDSYERNVINGLLMVDDITYEEVANQTGISEEIIRLYEQLFFNIMDRKQESTFLAEVVYPDGRLVEALEGYVAKESSAKLFMRSGYNNGVHDVLYVAGMKTNLLQSMSANDSADKLESLIMANGYLLARNGFVSQRNASGVQSAKGLILAAKQSGTENSQLDSSDPACYGDTITSDMDAIKIREANTISEHLDNPKLLTAKKDAELTVTGEQE